MEMNPIGLQNKQTQPIAFGRSRAIQTKSREVVDFLLKDQTNNFSQAYKTKFLKKYKFNIQEQLENNDLAGIMVSGFKKKVLSGFNYIYNRLPESERASKILMAKDKYSTALYNQAKTDIVQIKTLKDLRKNFPV